MRSLARCRWSRPVSLGRWVFKGTGRRPGLPTLLLLLPLALLALAGPARADKRVALVIGNAAYRSLKPLGNPANDAADVAAALKARDFTVIRGNDLDLAGMRRLVEQFTAAARDADLSLFYYAGHGFQLEGRNYLIPVDAVIRARADIDRGALDLGAVTAGLEGGRGNHLVFLDACRNNPLKGSGGGADAEAGLRDGLAKVGSAAGFLFAYATQPDNVAFDGGGRNSPFAQAFLGHLGTRGQDIGSTMIAVRRDVIATTGGFQVPWENSSLTAQVYLVPGRPESVSPETQLWQLAASSREPTLLRLYLQRHAEGPHSGEAQALLKVASADVSVGSPRSTPDDRLVDDGAADDRLWSFALRARLRPLVEFYLDRRPNGRHASEARELLETLPTAADTEGRPESVCERATTHPRDATADIPGVPLAVLARNAEPAIAACRAARDAHPETPHYTALLARALAAAGRKGESVALYREAAGRGNLRAQVSLGLILETGDGVPRDPAAGFALYERAAEGGSADGAINLAVALMEGGSVRKDPRRAIALLKKAAEDGSAIATYNLGVLAQDGTLAEPDRAVGYFRKATELGDPRGFVPAAILLDEGRGVRKDPGEAAEMLLRGVASDSGDATNQLLNRPKSWSADTLKAVQARLKRAGYYDGAVDGRGGQRMAAALARWRRVGSLDVQ